MKICTKIISNIFLFIFIIIFIDFISLQIGIHNENIKTGLNIKYSIKDYFEGYKIAFQKNNRYFFNQQKLRKIENIDSTKNPILIFGDSFAYGFLLKDKETFSYHLGRITKRPIYNNARNGWGPSHMLYLLNNERFYKSIPKPEYIIFVLNKEHISRIYDSNIRFKHYKDAIEYVFYKKSFLNNNDYLVRNKFKEKYIRCPFVMLIQQSERSDRINIPQRRNLNLLRLHFLQAYKFAKEHFGNNINFVIIFYADKELYSKYKTMLSNLSKDGFIIININELSNINFMNGEYTLKDGHPTAKAWKELTPMIVKSLGL